MTCSGPPVIRAVRLETGTFRDRGIRTARQAVPVRALIPAPLMLVVASCLSDGPELTEGEDGVLRERIGNVETVYDSREPLPGDELSPRLLWIAPSGERVHEWAEPRQVRVLGGMVYVLDPMAHQVHVVGRDSGEWSHSIGGRGRGPGELERPYALAVVGEEIAVGTAAGTIERFGMTGEHHGSTRLDRVGFNLHGLTTGEVLVHSLLGDAGGWSRVSRDGDVGAVSLPAGPFLAGDVQMDCFRTSSGPTSIFQLACDRLAFRVLNLSGVPVREVVVKGPVEAVDESALEAHLRFVTSTLRESGMGGDVIEEAVRRERERLQANPRVRSLRQDSETLRIAVWEQTPEELEEGAALVHFFSEDGLHLASVDFALPWVDFDLNADRILALVQDPETRVLTLRAYDLPWSALHR